uniref:Uncharacterized protein n=1 Tax=Cacopsylla melanoneura TaxID=428564 RepID=A0A8D8WVU2_9HEMI
MILLWNHLRRSRRHQSCLHIHRRNCLRMILLWNPHPSCLHKIHYRNRHCMILLWNCLHKIRLSHRIYLHLSCQKNHDDRVCHDHGGHLCYFFRFRAGNPDYCNT